MLVSSCDEEDLRGREFLLGRADEWWWGKRNKQRWCQGVDVHMCSGERVWTHQARLFNDYLGPVVPYIKISIDEIDCLTPFIRLESALNNMTYFVLGQQML